MPTVPSHPCGQPKLALDLRDPAGLNRSPRAALHALHNLFVSCHIWVTIDRCNGFRHVVSGATAYTRVYYISGPRLNGPTTTPWPTKGPPTPRSTRAAITGRSWWTSQDLAESEAKGMVDANG